MIINMKKVLFVAAIVLMSTNCFAQKNPAVKNAKRYIMAETPDFSAARTAIEEAIATEPTAETYYWAGMIGYQELTLENYNQMLGKGVNQALAGQAVVESYDYWLEADRLAMIPTLDKKGREVVDTKTRANISKKMLEYYKNQELVKYGIYLNEQRDFLGAYNAFKKHIAIPELDMMQNEKLQKEMPRDSNYIQYKYYTAIFAVQSELHEEAIALLNELKDGDFEAIAVNQFLYQEYVALKDTVNFVGMEVEKGFSDTSYQTQAQTCSLQNTIRDVNTANTNAILAKLDAVQTQSLLDKIDSLREKNSEQAVIINNAQQTANFNAMLNSYTAPIAAAVNTLQTEVASVKCRLPETVTLPYSCATAVPTNALYAGWSFGPNFNAYSGCGCNNSLWG